MLVPAILYKEQIQSNFTRYFYTDEMMYEQGYLGSRIPEIRDSDEGNEYQYAIVNKYHKLIGYLSYYIDWYSSSAYGFALFSFDKGNPIIGKDLFNELNKLIHEYKLHRIEWKAISDNPVIRNYEKFCKKYNGNIIKFTDVFKDRYGKYHDSYTYEILRGDEHE